MHSNKTYILYIYNLSLPFAKGVSRDKQADDISQKIKKSGLTTSRVNASAAQKAS